MIIYGKQLKDALAAIQRIDFDPSTHDGYIDILVQTDMVLSRKTNYSKLAKRIDVEHIDKEIGFQIKSEELFNIAKIVTNDQIELTIDSNINIVQEKTSLSLPLLNKTVKPIVWFTKTENPIPLHITKILTAFIAKPLINGLLWKQQGINSLTIVDESSIGIGKWNGSTADSIVIPNNGWNLFQEDVHIFTDENHMVLYNETTMVGRPKPKQTVPDVEESITNEKRVSCTCNTIELKRLLNNAINIAEKEAPVIKIKNEKNMLYIEVKNKYSGMNFKNEIESDGRDFNLNVPILSLIKAISAMPPKIETVTLSKLKDKPILCVSGQVYDVYAISLYMVIN